MAWLEAVGPLLAVSQSGPKLYSLPGRGFNPAPRWRTVDGCHPRWLTGGHGAGRGWFGRWMAFPTWNTQEPHHAHHPVPQPLRNHPAGRRRPAGRTRRGAAGQCRPAAAAALAAGNRRHLRRMAHVARPEVVVLGRVRPGHGAVLDRALRSEEHTSELQSLMPSPYA